MRKSYDEVLQCGQVLAALVQLGLRREEVPQMERAFFALREPLPGPLEKLSPFVPGTTAVDPAAMSHVAEELGGLNDRERLMLTEELNVLLDACAAWQCDHMPLPGDKIGERLGSATKVRMGMLVRLAAFSTLARVLGVDPWKNAQLREIVFTAAGL